LAIINNIFYKCPYLAFVLIVNLVLCVSPKSIFAQEDEEPILYFQMEPLDDSLFIKIQDELFIEPADPKAEIIVDLRNANDQTISIKSVLYPLLALSPEIRAQIVTYPFKINLEEPIHYGSVFTRVAEKIKLKNVVKPPTKFQISSTMAYINPFAQLFGGERFGWSLHSDVGFSFGIETEYSGPLETNYGEIGFHILGFYGGVYTNLDGLTDIKTSNNHNNLYVTKGFRIDYVIPFGNFFQLGYIASHNDFTVTERARYINNNAVFNSDGSIRYEPYLFEGSAVNWEFRYPVKVFGSTRGKIYFSSFMDELHIGFTGRELSLAGSVFDFRINALISSPVREREFVIEAIIQKVFDYWSFSSIAIGPSGVLGTLDDGDFGFTSIFFNIRFKMGTSL
jgi:hypothetical protein